MNPDIQQLLQDDLLDGERIMWSGQPLPKLFVPADIFLVPFSLVWGGFAIFWESMVLTQGAPLFFGLWGIPFVLIGLYIVFGRFFYKRYRQRRTYYAVTNKRVITLTNTSRRQIIASFIDQIPAINKSIRSDGTGTLTFGNPGFTFYANSGMDAFGRMYGGNSVPVFYDVAHADEIYQLVSDARRKQK